MNKYLITYETRGMNFEEKIEGECILSAYARFCRIYGQQRVKSIVLIEK